MGLFKKTKLTVPIFGISGAGKTWALCSLAYWATTQRKAYIAQGEAYMVPRLHAWQTEELTEKTNAGTYAPIELDFYPRRLSEYIDWRVRLETYDIAGDDYTGGAGQIYGKTQYKWQSPFFIDHLSRADAAIVLIDLMGPNWPKSHNEWILQRNKYMSAQGEYLNSAINALSRRTNLNDLLLAVVFTKSDLLQKWNTTNNELQQVFNMFASVAASKVNYQIYQISSKGGVPAGHAPRPAGIEELLKGIFLAKCK